MCKFKSGIIFEDRIELTPMYNDSHSRLLENMGIGDNFSNASRIFVRAELSPNGNETTDTSKWRFEVDQDIVPDWYKKDPERYEEEFRYKVSRWMKDKFDVICGKLCVKFKEDEKGIYYMTVNKLFSSKFGDSNNYETSYVREKIISSDFAKSLQNKLVDRLVPITTVDDYGIVTGDILALRTLNLHRECRKSIPNSDAWEWLATPYSTLSCCSPLSKTSFGGKHILNPLVITGGRVGYGWCSDVRAVRPFFILKAE